MAQGTVETFTTVSFDSTRCSKPAEKRELIMIITLYEQWSTTQKKVTQDVDLICLMCSGKELNSSGCAATHLSGCLDYSCKMYTLLTIKVYMFSINKNVRSIILSKFKVLSLEISAVEPV